MPWNEISRRYINSEPEFYRPDTWRERSEDKKQGSSSNTVETLHWMELDHELSTEEHPLWDNWEEPISEYTDYVYGEVSRLYTLMIDNGVCPEQARMVLPQSMMSSWIWSGTVKAIAKMCKLRCKPDTQYESRVIADKISEHMHTLFPVSWSALMGTNYPRIRPMSDDERQRAKEKAE
jgi:thymidylate synthase (FAD)